VRARFAWRRCRAPTRRSSESAAGHRAVGGDRAAPAVQRGARVAASCRNALSVCVAHCVSRRPRADGMAAILPRAVRSRPVGSPIAFGVAFQSNKSPAEYRALAEMADRYPFDVVSVYNDLLFQPALGPLLWMAPLLHRARLGPAALNPYTTHPIE